ncbi:MAG: TIM barrel protein [Clostridiaceae bacterium]|nr:TIM barrel protein [Clostridiaceae bacterium]
MKKWTFAARLDSFPYKPDEYYELGMPKISTFDKIDKMAQAEGVTHIEPNWPYQFDVTPEELKEYAAKYGLKVSGVGVRWTIEFVAGEITNKSPKKREKALQLLNDAVYACRKMGGTTTTIWSTYDGFDYPFQADYGKAWKALVKAYAEVAKANPDMKISIEYKPYEPRQFYFINDIGTTLLAIEDAKCDNLGVTLDFAHMVMKKENPAYSLALAAERGRLYGFHLNDGYGSHDDGLMIGSVNLMQTLEFIYYMKKYDYDGTIFFDTFPLRENAVEELSLNIKLFNAYSDLIDHIGMGKIASLVESQDAIAVQRLFLLETLLNKTFSAE